MHENFAETTPHERRRRLVVVSLVYERSSCSKERATARRALQEPLRGDGSDGDSLRARGKDCFAARFAPNRDQQIRRSNSTPRTREPKNKNKIKSNKKNNKSSSRTSNPTSRMREQGENETDRAAREGAVR
ncbi:unnamed protein product [Urochloa humidicola]